MNTAAAIANGGADEFGRREALADLEVESYEFGEGVKVVAQNNWNTDDADDFTKIIYVNFDEDPPEAESHKISFHVRFDADGAVDDAYGLAMSNGSDVGQRGIVNGVTHGNPAQDQDRAAVAAPRMA